MCKEFSLCSHNASDPDIFVWHAEGINQILQLSQDMQMMNKYLLWQWWYNIIASDSLRHGNQNMNSNFSSYFQMASKVHGKFVFIIAFFTDGRRKNIFSLEKTNQPFLSEVVIIHIFFLI